MRVLLIAPYSALPSDTFVNRFSHLARAFASRGHSTTFVTSRFSHRRKDFHSRPERFSENLDVVLVENRPYRSHIGLARVLSLRDFRRNFDAAFRDLAAYDLVYSAYPPIGHNLSVARKIDRGRTKLIVDVQDVWPESISSVIPSFKHLPVGLLPFSRAANSVYRSADALIAVSQTYLERATSTNSQAKSLVAYLGSEFALRETAPSDGPLRLFYIGTISYSYDIGTIVDAVDQLVNAGYRIDLSVFGDGPALEGMRRRPHAGTTFHGSVPYKVLEPELRRRHVAVNCIRAKAPQSVTNKLCDYLSLGCPILNSQENAEVKALLAKVVHRSYRAGDVASAARAILSMAEDESTYSPWIPNAGFSRSAISESIVDFSERLVSGR